MRTFGERILLAGLFVGLTTGLVFAQGSLTPPGAPTVSMKTLGQIEARTPISSIPFIVSQSGSYYLTDNLVIDSSYSNGVNGITITADNVSIDLNGFTIEGTVTSGGSGIYQSSSYKNLSIKDGKITGWGTVDECGIKGLGDNVTITDIQVQNNNTGIDVGSNAVLSRCVVSGNHNSGIICVNNAVIKDFNVSHNGDGFGFGGIFCENGATIIGCSVNENLGDFGIFCMSGSIIKSCTVFGNVGYKVNSCGICVIDSSSITDCTSSYNANDFFNSSYDGVGIYAGFSSTVRGCTVASNSGDGILEDGFCRIEGNLCDNNVFAGIHSQDTKSRIDGNNLTYNSPGILVESGGNFIFRNSAGENDSLDYDISGGNSVGEITLDPSTAGPWANFGSGSGL